LRKETASPPPHLSIVEISVGGDEIIFSKKRACA
jgi:hypothetical protein